MRIKCKDKRWSCPAYLLLCVGVSGIRFAQYSLQLYEVLQDELLLLPILEVLGAQRMSDVHGDVAHAEADWRGSRSTRQKQAFSKAKEDPAARGVGRCLQMYEFLVFVCAFMYTHASSWWVSTDINDVNKTI